MSLLRQTLLTLSLVVLSSTVFAQGEFLHKGESGFILSHSWDFSEKPIHAEGVTLYAAYRDIYKNWQTSTITAGFSYEGTYDITFTYREIDYLLLKSYQATVTYYIKKRRSWGMTGAGFMAGYSRRETLETFSFNTNYNERDDFLLGAVAFSNHQIKNLLTLQFYLAGTLQTTIETRDDGAIGEGRALFRMIMLPKSPIRLFATIGVGLGDAVGVNRYGIVEAGMVTAF